jgi:hypothetical protein
MKPPIKINLDLNSDKFLSEIENHEEIHSIAYHCSEYNSLFRGSLVELLWQQFNNSSSMQNLYVPFSARSYLLSEDVKGFYQIEQLSTNQSDNIILVLNLNNFYMPVYLLKNFLENYPFNLSDKSKLSLLITRDEPYCPTDYTIKIMHLIYSHFGPIEKILSTTEIFKCNDLSHSKFIPIAIEWLHLDSSLIHIILSKGGYIVSKAFTNLHSDKHYQLSPFHLIKLADIQNIPIQNEKTPYLPPARFEKAKDKMFSSGKIHEKLKIPYNFLQMIFKGYE